MHFRAYANEFELMSSQLSISIAYLDCLFQLSNPVAYFCCLFLLSISIAYFNCLLPKSNENLSERNLGSECSKATLHYANGLDGLTGAMHGIDQADRRARESDVVHDNYKIKSNSGRPDAMVQNVNDSNHLREDQRERERAEL